MSVVVMADRDAAKAGRWAEECAALLRSRREQFIYRQEPLAESVRRARTIDRGLVLLIDHGDNCMSGGTCDTTDVLEECLRQGLSRIGMGPVCDPQAVARLAAAGVGATIAVDVGNKVAMPQIAAPPRKPLRLTGCVKAIGDGEYTISGPTYTGTRCHMGRTVRFDTGAAELVLTEQTHEPWDRAVFDCIGLDLHSKRYLILKSRMYYRPVFAPLASAIIECAAIGVCSSDFSLYRYRKVRRPLYPLDAE